MPKRTTGFAMSDRYNFDLGMCSAKNGWAQYDSRQDASYFGNWVNPRERRWFSYCEGDTTLVECSDDEDFVKYVRETHAWYVERDGDFKPGIDPGSNEGLKAEFIRLGLGDLLH